MAWLLLLPYLYLQLFINRQSCVKWKSVTQSLNDYYHFIVLVILFSPWAESLSQPLWNFCFWLNIQFLFIQQDLPTVSLLQGLEKRTIIIIINIITFSLNPIKRINELLIFSPNHGNLTLFFGAT